jgi:hypothetical protein
MRDDRGDALPRELDAAVAALRRLPPTTAGAVDRVLAAVAADGRRASRARVGRRWWLGGTAGALLAASVGALLVARPDVAREAPVATVAAEPAPAAGGLATPVADVHPAVGERAAADAPQPVAFVVRRVGARRVALVGDFNRWDASATPMRRLADGTWTAEVPLTPGRHAYSFVVDGRTWVLDPRAPVAHDPDFGREHSVIVVGLP